jgi:hypothetical protein
MQVMDRSFERTEWKPLASIGKDSQSELPLIGEVPRPHLLDGFVLRKASFSGVLISSINHCGEEQGEIARRIHMSEGYMSRFIKGVGQKWASRLLAFMRVTNSLAPLQWLADQMGCDIAQRAGRDALIRELEQKLAEARRA